MDTGPIDTTQAMEMPSVDMDQMAESAKDASEFLKALSHETRLMILCLLMQQERSVTELEECPRHSPGQCFPATSAPAR